MDLAIARYGDAEGGGFFDRPSDAAPMGGLDVRRKPFQDSPTPGANSVAAIALIRLHAFTGDERYHNFAQKTLEAFAGIAPQYGLFRRDLRPRRDALRSPSVASRHHRPRGRFGRASSRSSPPTASTVSANLFCASRPALTCRILPARSKKLCRIFPPTKHSQSFAPGKPACRRRVTQRN